MTSESKLGFSKVAYHVPSLLKQRFLGPPACHPDTLTDRRSHPEGLCPRTAAVSAPPQILQREKSTNEALDITKTDNGKSYEKLTVNASLCDNFISTIITPG